MPARMSRGATDSHRASPRITRATRAARHRRRRPKMRASLPRPRRHLCAIPAGGVEQCVGKAVPGQSWPAAQRPPHVRAEWVRRGEGCYSPLMLAAGLWPLFPAAGSARRRRVLAFIPLPWRGCPSGAGWLLLTLGFWLWLLAPAASPATAPSGNRGSQARGMVRFSLLSGSKRR